MTGQALIRAMSAAGITSAALAARLGVSVYTVYGWRQSRNAPCCRYMELAVKSAVGLSTSTVDDRAKDAE